jgi:DNA-binding transcriptional LysR family regulator
MALLYEPPKARDLTATEVATLNLRLVSSRRKVGLSAPIDDYIHVDWGTSIRLTVEALLNPQTTTLLRVDTPMLAYRFLQNTGGTALLPETMVEDDLHSRRLHLLTDSPALERPVYLLRSAELPGGKEAERIAASLAAQ